MSSIEISSGLKDANWNQIDAIYVNFASFCIITLFGAGSLYLVISQPSLPTTFLGWLLYIFVWIFGIVAAFISAMTIIATLSIFVINIGKVLKNCYLKHRRTICNFDRGENLLGGEELVQEI
jgi:hypothetical protein